MLVNGVVYLKPLVSIPSVGEFGAQDRRRYLCPRLWFS